MGIKPNSNKSATSYQQNGVQYFFMNGGAMRPKNTGGITSNSNGFQTVNGDTPE